MRGIPLNRYPDPQPRDLIEPGRALRGRFEPRPAGRGSDEAIDLLVRAFCRPGVDAIAVSPPTFGMYALVHARGRASMPAGRGFLDRCEVAGRRPAWIGQLVPVLAEFRLAARSGLPRSSGSPTPCAERALVIVDEACIEFARSRVRRVCSTRTRTRHPAHAVQGLGPAGARIGCLLARAEVVSRCAESCRPIRCRAT